MNKSTKQQIRTKLTRSKLVRAALCPEMVLYRKYLLNKYAKSEDSEYIRSLHGKYAGKRCFIIGNGPSLTPEDLDRIKDEYCFASNRIYHIYSMTQWRPTWYLCIDYNVISAEIDTIKTAGTYPKLLNYKAERLGRKAEDNIHYVCFKGKYLIDVSHRALSELSDDVSKYVSWCSSVTITAIELAIYMGFKEIYLLGVDNSYAMQVDKDGKLHVDPTIKSNYFKGMKGPDGQEDSGNAVQYVDTVNYEYGLARDFAREKGITIYNATRGGKLEVFERVDFDEVCAVREKADRKEMEKITWGGVNGM